MVLRILLLALGAVAVWKGATSVVDGSTKVARFFGFPRLMVGLTIIAIGTSLPELGVGIFSAIGGDTALSLGNIIGAGFLNLCVVLGLAALINPVSINKSTLTGEAPFVVLAIALVWVLGIDGVIDRFDGILLLIAYGAFFFLLTLQLRNEHIHPHILNRLRALNAHRETHSLERSFAKLGIGVVALIIGAWLIVDSGVTLATWWGVPSFIIGMTLVSAGTVLPEMITSIIASTHHASDVNIGNVFGGVIFNTLFIIGVVSVIHSISVSQTLFVRDIPLLILATIVGIGFLTTGSRLVRWEGFFLIAMYVIYIVATMVATPAVH
ncbi:MAG: hypothetical protein A3H59_03345 [Candidatus Jacksonbacteria bacterium RIFCSPLOWO2_02_FULL_43_9]|nr:MAG: K+-dependent Na+/Ca+ exchanger family protein [Parcubacteria group bacterium GW2011_GWA2_43_13]OGY68987.1 MAG: hypothetical protein A3B94_02290 [Candidatus Jacksonbacteria bacterium RIFCSPHIGHO2_02_FULL_43_10]OGY70374.1 MAG: hypothetical protein A2986_00255 [Candidatus Jacksonbacteria bacterium RIFCSPLOWO2_01_FULL_44_13]OGY73616.1 MAG: hypothetical protein A3H59_03345 [Candidatus Jacksonbacteria bacterium RIFCSPLOWO2_02_FULL_43_9]HAZ16566.1 hypothetical protein [Candidatus Jacksonbacter